MNYKLIVWYTAFGVVEYNYFGYKTAREAYEDTKCYSFTLVAVLVNENNKVKHVFDHSKKYKYIRDSPTTGIPIFLQKGKNEL